VRPDQRIYSDVVTVKVGRQQPPAMVEDVGNAGPPPTAATAPELPGGTDSFVEKPMADPSAPSTTVPSSNVVTTVPSAPTTTEAKVAPAAVSVQLSTTTPIDVVSVAKTANITIPTGALVKMSVDKSAKKICAVQGSALVALKAGNCKVKVTVSVKGKKQSKSATISVAR
jgi:hypothetical protein